MADYTITVTNLTAAEQRAYDHGIGKANATITRENQQRDEQDPPVDPEPLITDAAGYIEWTEKRALPRRIEDEAKEDTTSKEIIAELRNSTPSRRDAALAALKSGR